MREFLDEYLAIVCTEQRGEKKQSWKRKRERVHPILEDRKSGGEFHTVFPRLSDMKEYAKSVSEYCLLSQQGLKRDWSRASPDCYPYIVRSVLALVHSHTIQNIFGRDHDWSGNEERTACECQCMCFH